MNTIHVLVVDDQFGRDTAERNLLLHKLGFSQASGSSAQSNYPINFSFCGGQTTENGYIVNDYSVIVSAISEGGATKDGGKWAAVLLDVQFDSGRILSNGLASGTSGDERFGLEVLSRLISEFPGLPVILFSSKGQRDLAGEQTAYLSKEGITNKELRKALLEYGCLAHEQAKALLGMPPEMVVVDDKSLAVFRHAFAVADSRSPILVTGETGTGKEIIARFIHSVSSCANQPFEAINVAAIPRDLVESELFGAEKGSFTGAYKTTAGIFELANHGTLFLDEIGDMPLDTQAKVLRAIQEKVIRRVGGKTDIPVDVRIISATHKDLPSLIAQGTFREDLFARLNGVATIDIPPLRERRDDIAPLTNYFMHKEMHEEKKKGITLSQEAMDVIKQYNFPRNVRELENLVKRIISLTGNNRVISQRDIDQFLMSPTSQTGAKIASPISGVNESNSVKSKTIEGIALANLPDVIRQTLVTINDSALQGFKPNLESAIRDVMRRAAGAALERCRHPVTGKIKLQPAMQLLTGNPALKGKGPERVFNEILGRPVSSAVAVEDIEMVVRDAINPEPSGQPGNT